jgi:putative effector of murein hydrolase LrgA (UPF0299 family)
VKKLMLLMFVTVAVAVMVVSVLWSQGCPLWIALAISYVVAFAIGSVAPVMWE